MDNAALTDSIFFIFFFNFFNSDMFIMSDPFISRARPIRYERAQFKYVRLRS